MRPGSAIAERPRRLCPAKPKCHYMLHLPAMICQVGYAANCFTLERRHKWLKEHSENRYRGFERALVNKMVCACVEQWRSSGPTPPPKLLDPSRSPEGDAPWAEVFGPCCCWGSTTADLTCGIARRGDLLRLAGGEAAWAVGFWHVQHAGGHGLFACVQPLRRVGPGLFAGTPGDETLRELSEARGSAWLAECRPSPAGPQAARAQTNCWLAAEIQEFQGYPDKRLAHRWPSPNAAD